MVWSATHKHENVSSDSQHPCGKPGMAVHTYTSIISRVIGEGGGAGRRNSPPYPKIKKNLKTQFIRRPHVKGINRVTINKGDI